MMIRITAAIGMICFFAGCTTTQLKRSTLNQASTLTDLQYRQILSNVAMYSENPHALPFHINLRDGSAQITDSGSAGVIGAFGLSMGRLSSGTPSISGSRTIVDQWSMIPVTDDDELKLLRMAYHNAYGAHETLSADEDFANDLGHELAKQTEVTPELQQDTLLLQGDQAQIARNPLKDPYARNMPDSRGESPERIAPITYRLFEKTSIASYDTCLECDLGRPRQWVVWIEATRQSYLSENRTFLFNHGGGTNNLSRLKIKAGDSVVWINHDDVSHLAPSGPDGSFPSHMNWLEPNVSSAPVTFSSATAEAGIPYFDEFGKKVGTIVVTAGTDCDDDEAGEARIRTILYSGRLLDNQKSIRNSAGDLIVEQPVEIQAGDAVAWINRGPNPVDIEIFDVSQNKYVPHEAGLSNANDINMSIPYFYAGFATRSAFVPRFFYRVIDTETKAKLFGQVSVMHKRVKSPLVKDVCRQLADVEDDLKEIPSGWFRVGSKKEVPKDACYVGNYGHRYAWVPRENLDDLSLFTLKILSLSSVLKDRQVVTGAGVRYSPGFANPGRF
jgi:plastocyanin